MNRNLYLCHFPGEFQGIIGNDSIYNNQIQVMFWTCPLAANHIKQRSTWNLLKKREPWQLSEDIKCQQFPLLFCHSWDQDPAVSKDPIPTEGSFQAREPHASRQRLFRPVVILWNAGWSLKEPKEDKLKRIKHPSLSNHTHWATWNSWVSFWHIKYRKYSSGLWCVDPGRYIY